VRLDPLHPMSLRPGPRAGRPAAVASAAPADLPASFLAQMFTQRPVMPVGGGAATQASPRRLPYAPAARAAPGHMLDIMV